MDWQDLSPAEKEAVKLMAFESYQGFLRVFFRLLEGQKFIMNWHHHYMCQLMEDVYYGREARLLINTPPGAAKTETISIHFPAWAIFRAMLMGSAGNNTRHFCLSYSDALIKQNGARTMGIVTSAPFMELTGAMLDAQHRAKNAWIVHGRNGTRHRYYAASLFGQVMGFRAGYIAPGYTGALLVDDPLPTKDEKSFVRTDDANKAMNRIVSSRLAQDTIPIGVIQQRIANGDTSDFLTGEKSRFKFHKVKIPALITDAYVDALPKDIRTRARFDTGIEEKASYWEAKEPLAGLIALSAADPFLFSSQYQQAPDDTKLEGVIYRAEIERMIADGRAGPDIPILTHVPVNTLWDLGIDDHMSIWLYQDIGRRRRFVGYYQNRDVGLEHYILWLRRYHAKFGTIPGVNKGPHDTGRRGSPFINQTNAQIAAEMGLQFEVVARPQLKSDVHRATKRAFPNFEINTDLCSMDPVDPDEKQKNRWGWVALMKYSRIYDPENEVFLNEPAHNWASHPADAFGLGGLTYEEPADNTPSNAAAPAGNWAGR